jgi:hypothetical protein
MITLNRRCALDLPVTGFKLELLYRVYTLASLVALLRLSVADLFVDVDFLARRLWAAEAVFLVDADLFAVAGVASVDRRLLNGGGEGFAMLFVTFPSDLRSLR